MPLPLPLALGVAQVLRVEQVLLRVAQVLPHAPQLRLAQVLQHAPSSEHYAGPRGGSRELPHAPKLLAQVPPHNCCCRRAGLAPTRRH